MKLKVIKPFRDKENLSHRFEIGAIVEFDKERALNALSLGLVEEIKELAEHQTATPAPSTEQPKEEVITEEPKEEVKEPKPAKVEKPKRGRKTTK